MSEWRPIPTWPEYEASSAGEIRRVGNVTSLRLHVNVSRAGYLQVGLWRQGRGRTCSVHRLVCEAFYGDPPVGGLDVAHRNGVKSDNRPDNLRWATRAENERDKVAHGRSNIGSRNGQAILSEQAVATIRERLLMLPRSAGGVKFRKGAIPALAEEYGVGRSAIYNIIYGSHWRHV